MTYSHSVPQLDCEQPVVHIDHVAVADNNIGIAAARAGTSVVPSSAFALFAVTCIFLSKERALRSVIEIESISPVQGGACFLACLLAG